jgi:hypothetical protein
MFFMVKVELDALGITADVDHRCRYHDDGAQDIPKHREELARGYGFDGVVPLSKDPISIFDVYPFEAHNEGLKIIPATTQVHIYWSNKMDRFNSYLEKGRLQARFIDYFDRRDLFEDALKRFGYEGDLRGVDERLFINLGLMLAGIRRNPIKRVDFFKEARRDVNLSKAVDWLEEHRKAASALKQIQLVFVKAIPRAR